jgi:hypothetical protein
MIVSILGLVALPQAANAAHRHHHSPRVVTYDDWGRCWTRQQHVWWQTICPAVRVAKAGRIIVR